jgi:hypothetical protein
MVEGHLTSNCVVTEVWSSARKPRLPGDDCGCERDVRFMIRATWGDEYVVKLCEKHGREPGIVEYMLP